MAKPITKPEVTACIVYLAVFLHIQNKLPYQPTKHANKLIMIETVYVKFFYDLSETLLTLMINEN